MTRGVYESEITYADITIVSMACDSIIEYVIKKVSHLLIHLPNVFVDDREDDEPSWIVAEKWLD